MEGVKGVKGVDGEVQAWKGWRVWSVRRCTCPHLPLQIPGFRDGEGELVRKKVNLGEDGPPTWTVCRYAPLTLVFH